MAVRSDVRWEMALLATVAACTGAVNEGIPRRSEEDLLAQPDAGLVAAGDAAVVARPDAAAPTMPPAEMPRLDGGASPVTPSQPSQGDSGAPKPRADAGSAPEPTSKRNLSTDATMFGGAPRCAAAEALYCEDFEEEGEGVPPPVTEWKPAFAYSPTVDNRQAARGKQALEFKVASGDPGHVERALGAIPKNTFFGRLFVYFDELPSGPDGAKWTLVAARGEGTMELRIGGQYIEAEKANRWGIGSDGGETGDWFRADRDPQAAPVAGKWTCLEWRFKGDTSETNVWIDGVEQPSLRTTPSEYVEGDGEMGISLAHPEFTKLRLGWWTYLPTTTPATGLVWIDEVVLDDERIGCVL